MAHPVLALQPAFTRDNYLRGQQYNSQANSAFFTLLPVETRNMIYGLMNREVFLPGLLSNYIHNPRLDTYPLGNLRLVSKRFKSEYEAELRLHAQFTCEINSPDPEAEPVKIAAAVFFLEHLARVRYATIRFPAWTADTRHEIPIASVANHARVRNHVNWLLRQLRSRKIVTIQCLYDLSTYERRFLNGSLPPILDILKQRYFYLPEDPRNETCDIQREMLLLDDLFVPYPQLDNWDGRATSENYICYRGRETSTRDTFEWCGLHLEMKSAGYFDEDTLQREIAFYEALN